MLRAATVNEPKAETSQKTPTKEIEKNNFCGCGWPDHMLIPKGTPEGFPVELFVMISDYKVDRVAQDDCKELCERKVDTGAASYCGVQGGKYPDKRAMGFPFDRLSREDIKNLNQFLAPNMKTQDCKIIFNDRIEKIAEKM